MRVTILLVLIILVIEFQCDNELLLSSSNYANDFDCLNVDNRLFCRRSEVYARSECLGISWIFADLAKHAVTTDQLLEWHTSIDVIERYANDNLDMNGRFCNCTNQDRFGTHCEYIRPNGNLAEWLAQQSERPQQRVAEKMACFGDDEYFRCNAGLPCLEWRQVCDGIMHCDDGTDERDCEKLEFNRCASDEFQCRNGMCIPHTFLFDGTIDCLDMTDEQENSVVREIFEKCPEKSSLECDERLCRKDEFSCGDGSCVPWSNLFHHRRSCDNLRDMFYRCETRKINEQGLRMVEETGRCQVGGATTKESCSSNLRNLLRSSNRKPSAEYLHANCPEDMQLPPESSLLSPNLRLLYNTTAIVHFYVQNEFKKPLPDPRPHRYCLHGSALCHGNRITLIREECLDADTFDNLDNHTYFPLPFIFCQVAAAQLNSSFIRYSLTLPLFDVLKI